MTDRQEMSLGQSVRTIIELLILAGVLWLANSANETGKQLAAINVQITALTTQIADVPALQRQATINATQIAEHERRIRSIEDRRTQ